MVKAITDPVEDEALKDDLTAEESVAKDAEDNVDLDPEDKPDDDEQELAADDPVDPDAESEEDSDESEDESDEVSDDIKEWAEKKNLPLDDPLAIVKMYRESEKKMTQSNQKVTELRKQAEKQAEEGGDEFEDEDSKSARVLLNKLAVTDFYMNNPDARGMDSEMAAVLAERPNLANDLDAVYLIAKNQTSEEQLVAARKEGEKKALKTASQTQRQNAPKANAKARPAEKKDDPFEVGFDEG